MNVEVDSLPQPGVRTSDCQAAGVFRVSREVEPGVLPQLQGLGEILGDEGKSAERVNFVRDPKWSCYLLFREPPSPLDWA